MEADGRRSLIVRAVEGSTEYRIGVGDRLKQNAFVRRCLEESKSGCDVPVQIENASTGSTGTLQSTPGLS
jgi:hypothetical protein